MPVVRSGGRSVYGHVIAKFSRMGSLLHFLTHGAPLKRNKGSGNKNTSNKMAEEEALFGCVDVGDNIEP